MLGSATPRPRRVVVIGADAAAVGLETARRRRAGERVAGFVGTDQGLASTMAAEMLGGLDELVELPGGGPELHDGGFVRPEGRD